MDGFVYVSQDPWKEKSLAWHTSLSISVSTERTIVSKQPTTFANSQNASASMSRFAKIGGKAANNRIYERRLSRGKNYLGRRGDKYMKKCSGAVYSSSPPTTVAHQFCIRARP